MGFEDVPWLPLCVGLTVLGLILTWTAGRRRGAAAATRGVAWSLLPLVAYLTGILPLAWDIVTRLIEWGASLILSPRVWAGVALAAVAALLFLVSGVMRGRALARSRAQRGERPAPAVAGGDTQPLPYRRRPLREMPSRAPAKRGAQPDDDFAEVEEILRRRGIT